MWVRYDDGFHNHPKTLEAVAIDPGSISLHLLCNTWQADNGTDGVVTLGAVISKAGTRARGLKWARILVAAGLWHAEGHGCDRCAQPPKGGYVFHDIADYSSAKRDAEITEKRREAGRKGAAARWGTDEDEAAQTAEPMANAIANAWHDDGTPVALAIVPHGKPMATACQTDSTVKAPGMASASPPHTPPLPEPEPVKNNPPSPPPGGTARTYVRGSDEDPEFAAFWDAYPLKKDKGHARRAWRAALRRGVSATTLIEAAQRFRNDPARKPGYTRYPATWLNGESYGDYAEPVAVNSGFWDN